MQLLKKNGIDFRNLMALKNALFDCEDLEANRYVPLKDWQE